jgi:hypothetical protein
MNMSQELKENWLPKQQARYARRDREGKTRMLDELCEDHGYDRKYAIKLLRGWLSAPTGRPHPGAQPQYGLVEPIVREIWLAGRAALRQPLGAHSQAVAALLRTALRRGQRTQMTARDSP